MEKNSAGVRNTVIAIALFIVLVVVGFVWRMHQPVIMSDRELQANGAIEFKQPRIFNDFNLLDHKGRPFTLENLKGKWSIVFFGFTHCPDVCPTTLAELGKMYSKLSEKEQQQLQIVMVSLDAERDSVERLEQYVPYFDSSFVGVTGTTGQVGTMHQIRRLAGELNIAYNRVELGGDNYTIDHSTQLVLINPYGHYHGFFKAPHNEMILRKTWRSISATFEG